MWDAGQVGCRKGGMQEKRDTESRDERKGGIRTGGMQKRKDLGLEVYRKGGI